MNEKIKRGKNKSMNQMKKNIDKNHIQSANVNNIFSVYLKVTQ